MRCVLPTKTAAQVYHKPRDKRSCDKEGISSFFQSLREMHELISRREGAKLFLLVSEPETSGHLRYRGVCLAPESGESSNHPWWVVLNRATATRLGSGAMEVFGRDNIIMCSYALLEFATRYLSFHQPVMEDRFGTRVGLLLGGGAADTRGGVRRASREQSKSTKQQGGGGAVARA